MERRLHRVPGPCSQTRPFLLAEVKNPDLPCLAFLDFLALFVVRNFRLFLFFERFSLLSQGFWGFGREKNPCSPRNFLLLLECSFFPRDFRGPALLFWVVFLAGSPPKKKKERKLLGEFCEETQ